MKWFGKIERRLAPYAIPNLTLGVILAHTLTFLVLVSKPELYPALALDTRQVMAGEWWRLLTFMLMPSSLSPIWFLFAMYFLFLMGRALENEWGDLRYNLYWLIGYLASAGFAFLVPGQIVTNGYLVTSIFLAFAFLFPDFVIYLFLILPIKVKWIALFTWLFYGYTVLAGIGTGYWGPVLMVAAATLNFFLFFGKQVVLRMKQGHRTMKRKQQALAAANEPFHHCSVCGLTDLANPKMEFRYAKQGDEVVGYCLDHLPDNLDA